ncbi:NAD(P) transhydrogenase subunit alpha [Cyclobacterium lianum]|uniref:NAD(P) transhydrogenase subunit alpha part 1 n=1 Tax=Cyclobacterium lianum TaxID=388280 RepID=A0A1M7L8Z1_9BACT|nr:Re/Si-specific NAD(P)(+) transhydrogenase subunit alpha [Cyclobacterium lianum]SHM73836.1 NAD(P) transhydrogenase subunit alpha [Cyclobacterium lianum]
MILGILKEPSPETRVSLHPEAVKALNAAGNKILIEKGAGEASFLSDEHFSEAGAELRSRAEVLKDAEMIFQINPLSSADHPQLGKGKILFGVYQPLVEKELMHTLAKTGVTLFSMDSIPRITRAQSMDVLSSMSTVSGYKAVLLAAAQLPRFFPMLMTAAGTIAPAKVLVIGAGVAGLQAIATAKRLGAVVEAFDTRPSVKEQVESLGGKFVEVPGAVEDKAAGGYAVEQSEEYKQKQSEMLEKSIVKSDVVITTALIPGKKAPVLITKPMLQKMKAGAVVVDLAAANGGNCEGAVNKETVIVEGVTIIGNSSLPATMPEDASKMYSKNVQNLLKLLLKEDQINLNFDDDIVKGTCITHDGNIVYEPLLK